MSYETHRIAYLDNLRLLMVFFVVGIHALEYVGIEKSLKNIVLGIIQPLAVPMFFLVDGFIFSMKYNSGNSCFHYVNYITKSFKRIFLPWILFNIIYISLRSIFEYAGYFDKHIWIESGFGMKLAVIYTSAVSIPLYFLFSLFLIRLFSFASLTISSFPRIFQFALIVVYISFFTKLDLKAPINFGADPILHAIWGYQFYLLGIIIDNCSKYITKYYYWILGVCIFILIISKAFDVGINDIIYQFLYIAVVYLFLRKMKLFAGKIGKYGKYTMGIYILHTPIIIHACSKITNSLIDMKILSFFMTTIITFILSLFAYSVIVKMPYGKFLFGEWGPEIPLSRLKGAA